MGLDREGWLAALRAVRGEVEDENSGAVTVSEFAQMSSLPRPTAQRYLLLLVEKGMAVETRRISRHGNGAKVLTAYRLTAPKGVATCGTSSGASRPSTGSTRRSAKKRTTR
jgi:hypothetical protein